ncbi:TonB-dependent receptor [Glaciecola sp. MH2013]|uniref:TonB-dependent receptor domain-containing protein n=1 Tax=Glaciecola sp. MH2013 TaxID=2785524 RepID=UPI0018A080B9|nr:TonB-dependent receptor [Glaciecola sp. MH2013]MBF7071938.1 TonB-dependent receptor [Glaciecola sp. MH2013]
MNQPAKRFPVKQLTLAVLASLTVSQSVAFAQDDEEAIEEVVATGTRLKGTATAVLEERKNQAFVADILGAEQISRTGDSDAASALRRVTGLTLVDGKFIYVRGLGERYSSTQLNGAAVPSPDPTRNVIPLDLFPSDIIESLSVQKSFSPSMPASFGGGNVDIRLKTLPTQFVFNVSGSIGYDTENSGDALAYNGGDKDWQGRDDGTRAAPQSIASRWENKDFLDNLEPTEALALFKDVNRDYDPFIDSVGPDAGFSFSLGNSYNINDELRYGFLVTSSYNADTTVSKEYELQQADRVQEDIVIARFFDDILVTESTVKWSTMINFGIDYNRNHAINYSLILLNDTRDEVSEKFGNTENINQAEGLRIRDIDVEYEERKLFTNQLRGMHTFPELDFAGLDWQYSVGRSVRKAPGNFSSRFIISDDNEDGVFDASNEIVLNNSTTAARYSFQTLHDRLENFGYNINYPMAIENWEMEVKFGGDFVSKTRTAENRRFDVNTRAFSNTDLLIGDSFFSAVSDTVLNDTSNFNLNGFPILRDTTIAGDDYAAAQKVDAYYVEGDFFYKNKWRFSGGVRWEDFRQVVAPFDPRTNQFDLPDDADRSQLAFNESDFYPAIAFTYIPDESMQYRASIGKTVVRPDLREVSSSTFIDPLTEFPIAGTPGIKTTSIINFDLRWEWYREAGDNLSVGLFFKDMDAPIESVQSPAQDGPPLIRIANAETGLLYGVEIEFLQGLDFIDGEVWDNIFVSGNLTLSDSEIELDRQNIVDQTGVSAAITNLKRRLTGHSQYVLNLQGGFDSDNGEHSVSLVYNVFGDRILIPGIDGFEDSFEQPFHSFDTVYKYYPDFNTTITVKVQNILGETKLLEFEDVLLRSESRGRQFSLSYKYDF